MNYYLVITPQSLADSLISESKRLMKTVYKKDVDLLYYRVQTKQKLDNPRRLFIKGDGRVIETQVKPHVNLVHNIQLDNPKDFITKAKNICSRYKSFELKYKGVGNYDMDFTFFVQFEEHPQLEKLRNNLLGISKGHMSKEECERHQKEKYIPHATILYDDTDPKKVSKAHKLLDRTKFKKNIPVKEVVMWKVSGMDLNVIARFKLGK